MPIYEYECRACGARMEKLIRNPADVPVVCEKCGAAKPRKALSSFSVARPAAGKGAACKSCADSPACPYSGGGCGCAGE
jgi:putative FmdB family regulatory protein